MPEQTRVVAASCVDQRNQVDSDSILTYLVSEFADSLQFLALNLGQALAHRILGFELSVVQGQGDTKPHGELCKGERIHTCCLFASGT